MASSIRRKPARPAAFFIPLSCHVMGSKRISNVPAPLRAIIQNKSAPFMNAPPARRPPTCPALWLHRQAASTAQAASPLPRHPAPARERARSEEHTSELQSLMRISYAVFCLKKKTHKKIKQTLIQRRNKQKK